MITLIYHAPDYVAERTPERPAIKFLEQSLSYGDLAARSNALAHILVDAGVTRGEPVGIYMDKCIDTAVALYGIMKAGAAYVPLDPAAPPARSAEIARSCGMRCVVTGEHKASRLAQIAQGCALEATVGLAAATGEGLRNYTPSEVRGALTAAPPRRKIIEQDLAYIMYTSGSTGAPKGMMHTHASGLSFARWAAHEYRFHAEDVLSNHAPLHFDLSIMDFFSAALAGCATAIVPEAYTRLPASYSQLIQDQGITVLYTVPFALIQLLLRGALEQRDLSALRWAIFGGEPMPLKHLRALREVLPWVSFDNIYGPAEVNGVTHYTVRDLAMDADSIPIGPIADTAEALIVDEQDREVPPGVDGELLVRSPTMMRGYWGRPELNERAFYRRERIAGHEEVFYRTGDVVREDHSGLLWFLGRKDRQVKVRGYRVELDEIEAALSAIAVVEEAGVFVVSDADGGGEIHAAVTLKGDAGVDSGDLTSELKRALPWYSVPSSIELRKVFPRTSSGKIDRRALREAYSSTTTNRV